MLQRTAIQRRVRAAQQCVVSRLRAGDRFLITQKLDRCFVLIGLIQNIQIMTGRQRR